MEENGEEGQEKFQMDGFHFNRRALALCSPWDAK